MSARRRYRLHSGENEGPRRAAKAMVARRESVSWRMVRRRADVGVVVASPTPTPGGQGWHKSRMMDLVPTFEDCARAEETGYGA